MERNEKQPRNLQISTVQEALRFYAWSQPHVPHVMGVYQQITDS